MLRVIVIALSVLLPTAALAQANNGSPPPEAPSRAQAAQMIANHGYFEVHDLRELPDGSWSCTALAGPGQRVVVVMDKNGHVTESDLPSRAGQ